MSTRTERNVAAVTDAENTIALWAEENGLKRDTSAYDRHRWVKNLGALPYPAGPRFVVEYLLADNRVELFLNVSKYGRIKTLGMLPSEMAIDGGGFKGALPKRIVKPIANDLFQRLGVERI